MAIPMDMSKHLRRWLNDAELARREHGAYEGVIADVVEETVRNPFTTQPEVAPVIVFEDGWRLIPNFGMRAQLVTMFGPETDVWRGRRVRVFRRSAERVDKKSGEVKTTWVKTVMACDARPTLVARAEPTPHEWSDYDDSDEAIAAAARRRSGAAR